MKNPLRNTSSVRAMKGDYRTREEVKLEKLEGKLRKKRGSRQEIFEGTRKGKTFGDGYKD